MTLSVCSHTPRRPRWGTGSGGQQLHTTVSPWGGLGQQRRIAYDGRRCVGGQSAQALRTQTVQTFCKTRLSPVQNHIWLHFFSNIIRSQKIK